MIRRLAAIGLAVALAACAGAPVPVRESTGGYQPPAASTAIGGPNVPIPPAAAGAAPVRPSPVISVDGQLVLAREDAIVVAEAGQTRPVFTPASGGRVKDPTWSPDGRAIAFTYQPPRPREAPPSERRLVSDVMVVGADGAGARPLVRHEAPGQIVESPFWTPDGKAVLYSTYTPNYKAEEVTVEAVEVRRFDVAAGTSALVATGALSPAISRDGRWIAFVGDDPELGPSLQVMPSSGGAARTLVAVNEFLAFMAPRFSPNGQTIAFAAVKFLPGPGQSAPRASTPLDVVRQLLGPGTAVAHGMPWEIWAVPTAGGALRQLTHDTLDTPSPAWSSDGARILVYSATGVHLVDVASGRADALSSTGTHGGMDWRSGSGP